LLAQVEEPAQTQEVLLNCATLAYTNVVGEPQPEREACADVNVGTAADSQASAFESAPVRYLTDEAMRLGAVLYSLSCEATWGQSELAASLTATNLGNLLQASSLGVPLAQAPGIGQGLLASLAAAAGLQETPNLSELIYLPYNEGIPVLQDGLGFGATEQSISPAALGWTLRTEVLYAESCHRTPTALAQFLLDLDLQLVALQLEWISTQLVRSEAGTYYLPHRIQVTESRAETTFGVPDPSSWIYDQSSLLQGLLAVSASNGFDVRSQRLADQLAEDTFDHLALHWDGTTQQFQQSVGGDFDTLPAPWRDMGVLALALRAARTQLPLRRGQADTLLQAIAQLASETPPLRDRETEANRVLALLVAYSVLNDAELLRTAMSGWTDLRASIGDPASSSVYLSVRAQRGWPSTPRQLAVLFEVLAELVALDPASMSVHLEDATRLLAQEVQAGRVQLRAPTRLWQLHATTSCRGLAPVFGIWEDATPDWLDWLP